MLGRYRPQADPPEQSPPLGRDQPPWQDIPLRRQLKLSVRILLKCILVQNELVQLVQFNYSLAQAQKSF